MPSPAATRSALVAVCLGSSGRDRATSSNRTRTSPRLIAVELRYNELAKLDRTGWKVTIVDPPYA
jgi:hypothetical protein